MDLRSALEYMNSCHKENQRRFDVEFVSLDLKRKTGGVLKSLRRCRVASAAHNIFTHGTINVLPNTGTTEVTIHVRLILKLNGELIHG